MAAPFDGARVLVTGGASGIGAATCEVLAAEGWEPIPADLDPPDAGVALDVTDEASWATVLDGLGSLRGLVTCAGIRTRGDIVDTTAEEFRRHLDVNVTGTWLAIREFLRRHERDTHGAIVTIASVVSAFGVPGQAHYVASKGAVSALTRAAALEGAPLGVRVNAIGPGPIRTPMTTERLVEPAQVAWLETRVPLKRVGEPSEIGRVAEFLLSDAASYMTGETVYVDGGWVANGA